MNRMKPVPDNTPSRYHHADLSAFASRLLSASGLESEKADVVAEILLEGDLMRHDTHGLQLLGPYLEDLKSDKMAKQGQPQIISDNGSTLLMDGFYLPGPWLVVHALNTAIERIEENPVMTVVIRRSHHIACLSSYLKKATDKGLILLLFSSDPSVRSVAPFGGLRPVYTPNPLAAGIPTENDPILLDISMSCTTNGLVARLHKLGQKLPHSWLLDNNGTPTDDAAVFFTDPPGTILPLGGMDLGYKGYAMGILIEALTSALAGFGRADEPTQWGASVFLQVINPQAFAGSDAFRKETQWLADTCRRTQPIHAGKNVRLPGDYELAARAEQLKKGVQLRPEIFQVLKNWAEKLCIPIPKPIIGN